MDSAYVGHEDPIFAVAAAPDAKTGFSGGKEKKIHYWAMADGKKLGEIGGFDDDVLRLIVGGGFLFSSSADGKVRQHSLESKELVRIYDFDSSADWVYGLAYCEKAGLLAAGNYRGEVRVWDIKDGKLLTHFIAAPK